MAKIFGALLPCVLAASCGGGGSPTPPPPPPPTFTIGLTVTGLAGAGLTLRNNGGAALAVTSDGAFTFSGTVASGASYNVTIEAQPTATPPQTCAVASGTGTVGNANVVVSVTCRAKPASFVYVAAAALDGIAAFAVDANTGALTPIAGSPFATTGASPQAVFANLTGKFLYVYGDNDIGAPGGTTITGFTVNAQTGALTPIPGVLVDFPASASPVAMHPSGNFFYVPVSEAAQTSSNRLHAFALDSTTGALTAISGSPYAAPGNEIVNSVVLSPSGASLYLASSTPFSAGPPVVPATGRIRQYAVNPSTGALSVTPSEAIIAGNSAFQLFMNPAGTHMYSRNTTSPYFASQYKLEPATGEFFGSRSDYPIGFGYGVIMAPVAKVYFPVLGGAFGAPQPGSVYGWGDQSLGGGTLPGSPYATNGSNSLAATLDPTGRFIALTNLGTQTISVMRIDSLQGGLTHIPGSPYTPAVGTAPGSVTFDPSAQFAYLTDAQTRSISSYAIDAVTGVPTFVSSQPMQGSPAVSPVAVLRLQ